MFLVEFFENSISIWSLSFKYYSYRVIFVSFIFVDNVIMIMICFNDLG